ncbi:mannan endo-1,4-beta-mannosidase D [Tothia fuscella]|uniref:mannan endo-1,4-beta-mannosidase n=1 Tax=Tothia fuscella TaxID=1048955 RepID=A0A9P4NNY5_9PEZI|nr:mannan endo-1,4-beta-mannosidase D [Tothia fuscella]
MTLVALFALVSFSASFASASLFPKVGTGLKFEIENTTTYVRGTNAYWLPFQNNLEDIDLALDHIAASGLKVVRTWGFNDVTELPPPGVPYFQAFLRGGPPQINTGPDGLQRLDYVVAGAAKRGLKLVIPFVNNWKDYGGMPTYLKYYGGLSNKDWYLSQRAQEQYQKYINVVIGRYINNTAIFAWELANEPRCQGCDTSVIANWAAQTSRYIKSIDPNHMVTLGDEGHGVPGDSTYPYGTSEGSDFVKNLAIPDLDFGTFHFYPDAWHVKPESGSKWVQDHAAACAAAKKPCVFEEYGLNGALKCAKMRPWQKTSISTVGMAGDMYWQAGDALSSGLSSDDGNTIYPNTENYDCIVTEHAKDSTARRRR